MMENRNDTFDNLILICGIVIALYSWLSSHQEELLRPFEQINWLYLGIWVFSIISVVMLLFFAYQKRRQHLERKRAELDKLQRQEKELKTLLSTDFSRYSSEYAQARLIEVKKSISSFSEKVTSKYDLNKFYAKAEEAISCRIEQERKEHSERARKQAEQEEARKKAHLQEEQRIKESKIQVEKPTIERHGKPLERSFYRVKDLSEEERLRALAQGFKHYRGTELDGHLCIGGFYIKNSGKESPYHFTAKHLFAELRPNAKIEYGLGDKRADVAYFCTDYNLGLEVETGTNKPEQLAAKIPWLNDNFSQWIFVCSRTIMSKYLHLVDSKKSFCLPPKRAKEKVLELTAPKRTEKV